ncbi:MAG: sterol desaturase family protein [Novosphingobium sp.]|nr:sterol desaturase family protein [Novosphingobium sp.]
MNTAPLEAILHTYAIHLSILAFVLVALVNKLGAFLVRRVPTAREAEGINRDVAHQKLQKPNYVANMMMNRKWGTVFSAVIFGLIMPFCLTLETQVWWMYPVQIVTILMVYDFFYYWAHRVLFHDTPGRVGPLKWVHATHHRQLNPCRMDSAYLNPIETAIGLGLYVLTIALLSLVFGRFHVGMIVVTWVAFQQINLHNHDLWPRDKLGGGYIATMTEMHHHHHARFTGGNFATISLLYDWMFGTLDYGKGPGVKVSRAERFGEAEPRELSPET